MKISISFFTLILACFMPFYTSAQDVTKQHNSLEALEVQHEQSLYHVQSEWTNQNNETVVLQDFAERPLIVVMFYGQCTGTCPVLIQRTWNLYQQLDRQSKEQVQVLAVSFDYKKDTPQALKAYAEMEKLDLPNWHFVTSNHSSIRELAMLLGVQYRERNDGHFEHSNLITVLDGEGKITERVSGLQQPLEEAVTVIDKISKGVIQ